MPPRSPCLKEASRTYAIPALNFARAFRDLTACSVDSFRTFTMFTKFTPRLSLVAITNLLAARYVYTSSAQESIIPGKSCLFNRDSCCLRGNSTNPASSSSIPLPKMVEPLSWHTGSPSRRCLRGPQVSRQITRFRTDLWCSHLLNQGMRANLAGDGLEKSTTTWYP